MGQHYLCFWQAFVNNNKKSSKYGVVLFRCSCELTWLHRNLINQTLGLLYCHKIAFDEECIYNICHEVAILDSYTTVTSETINNLLNFV